MIAADGLTKRFGPAVAVDDVTFDVQEGELVGLVGHDGAGKTTTLRMLVGHVHPTAGRATVLGKPYADLDDPLRDVGALVGHGIHPARRVRDHLRICAALAGLGDDPVDDVLRTVGLEEHATRRGRELSTPLCRRAGLAAALLAGPQVLILDEPGEGLDPTGMLWLRTLLRHLADDGCAVLVTSREAGAVADVADRVLVMDRGSLLTRSAPQQLTEPRAELLVRTPGAEVLAEELRRAGIEPIAVSGEEVRVRDAPASVVSKLASSSGVPVWEIREDAPSLEDAVEDLVTERGSNGGRPEAGGEERAAGENGEDDEDRDRAADEARDRGAAAGGEPPGARSDAEAALDAELAALPGVDRANVVALVAPAAGLGRTTLAFLVADVLAASADIATLAIALSCDGERISAPAAADARTTLDLENLLGDLPDFDETSQISPYVSVAASGAHVVGGPSDEAALGALEPARIDALLDFAGRFYGLVVVDVGELGDDSLRAVVRRADRVLLLGAPGAVDDLARGSGVLDAIEAEHDKPAILVFNRIGEDRLRSYAHGTGPGSHVLVPHDPALARALEDGDFDLEDVEPVTRYALKRLGLAVAEGLR